MTAHHSSRLRAASVLALALVASLLLAPAAAQDRGLALDGPLQPGRYYALVIGNNKYQSLPKLKTAEADAAEVEAVLKSFYGFQTRLLLNATRQQIIAALAAYRRELSAESNLLIYYAGHGLNDREVDKAYWLPVDASKEDAANWISADDITTTIKAIPARHVLIVSDSCYSGTLTRGFEPSVSAPAERERFLNKMMSGRSRTLMASGGNEPVADGGGGNHSVFANALLRGLRQTERVQFTAAELFREFVEVNVAGRADQTPEYNPLRNSGHESGDFVFVKVKTGGGQAVEVTVRTPASSPAAVELSFWESVKGSSDPEDFKAYLQQYPRGSFAALANNRLRALANAKAGGGVSAASPFATPQAVVETFIRAGVERDAETLSKCFALNSAGEFRKIREKQMTKAELDDLASFVEGASVNGAQMGAGDERAIVAVRFRSRDERITVTKTPDGWKIVDF